MFGDENPLKRGLAVIGEA